MENAGRYCPTPGSMSSHPPPSGSPQDIPLMHQPNQSDGQQHSHHDHQQHPGYYGHTNHSHNYPLQQHSAYYQHSTVPTPVPGYYPALQPSQQQQNNHVPITTASAPPPVTHNPYHPQSQQGAPPDWQQPVQQHYYHPQQPHLQQQQQQQQQQPHPQSVYPPQAHSPYGYIQAPQQPPMAQGHAPPPVHDNHMQQQQNQHALMNLSRFVNQSPSPSPSSHGQLMNGNNITSNADSLSPTRSITSPSSSCSANGQMIPVRLQNMGKGQARTKANMRKLAMLEQQNSSSSSSQPLVSTSEGPTKKVGKTRTFKSKKLVENGISLQTNPETSTVGMDMLNGTPPDKKKRGRRPKNWFSPQESLVPKPKRQSKKSLTNQNILPMNGDAKPLKPPRKPRKKKEFAIIPPHHAEVTTDTIPNLPDPSVLHIETSKIKSSREGRKKKLENPTFEKPPIVTVTNSTENEYTLQIPEVSDMPSHTVKIVPVMKFVKPNKLKLENSLALQKRKAILEEEVAQVLLDMKEGKNGPASPLKVVEAPTTMMDIYENAVHDIKVKKSLNVADKKGVNAKDKLSKTINKRKSAEDATDFTVETKRKKSDGDILGKRKRSTDVYDNAPVSKKNQRRSKPKERLSLPVKLKAPRGKKGSRTPKAVNAVLPSELNAPMMPLDMTTVAPVEELSKNGTIKKSKKSPRSSIELSSGASVALPNTTPSSSSTETHISSTDINPSLANMKSMPSSKATTPTAGKATPLSSGKSTSLNQGKSVTSISTTSLAPIKAKASSSAKNARPIKGTISAKTIIPGSTKSTPFALSKTIIPYPLKVTIPTSVKTISQTFSENVSETMEAVLPTAIKVTAPSSFKTTTSPVKSGKSTPVKNSPVSPAKGASATSVKAALTSPAKSAANNQGRVSTSVPNKTALPISMKTATPSAVKTVVNNANKTAESDSPKVIPPVLLATKFATVSTGSKTKLKKGTTVKTIKLIAKRGTINTTKKKTKTKKVIQSKATTSTLAKIISPMPVKSTTTIVPKKLKSPEKALPSPVPKSASPNASKVVAVAGPPEAVLPVNKRRSSSSRSVKSETGSTTSSITPATVTSSLAVESENSSFANRSRHPAAVLLPVISSISVTAAQVIKKRKPSLRKISIVNSTDEVISNVSNSCTSLPDLEPVVPTIKKETIIPHLKKSRQQSIEKNSPEIKPELLEVPKVKRPRRKVASLPSVPPPPAVVVKPEPYQLNRNPLPIPTVFVKSTPLGENAGDNDEKEKHVGPSLRVICGKVKFYRGSDEEDNETEHKLPREKVPVQFDGSLSWICVFCQMGPHVQRLGDLYGPYYVKEDGPEGAKRLLPEKRETWMHEDCSIWAHRVLSVGSTIRGLDDAVYFGDHQNCNVCGLIGATVFCLKRGCKMAAHFPCAKIKSWKLDASTMFSFCPDHTEV